MVDLTFQRVQNSLTQGLSSVALLAYKLAKVAQTNTPISTKGILQHIMDSLALVSQTIWILNMKKPELIKPDLESLFAGLCKPETAHTTKPFGDDLSKQLKEQTGTEWGNNFKRWPLNYTKRCFYQKLYDQPPHTSNRKANMGNKPFLAHS